MSKGFDIKDVKVKSSREVELEKLLTNSVTGGLSDKSRVKPNAEAEGGEYLRYPTGEIQKILGHDHEKGGVKLNMPEGTQILSKSLNVKKKDAKKFEKAYGLNVSDKDTYASLVDKYNKKIGLDKLNKEQEELFEVLRKQLEDKTLPKPTQDVNKEYISKKIAEIENKKATLTEEQNNFFTDVFETQESYKKPENIEGEYKYGGLSEEAFNTVLQKNGLTREEGLRMLGELPKFVGGGTYEELVKELSSKGLSAGTRADYLERLKALDKEGKVTQEQYQDFFQPLNLHAPESKTGSKGKTPGLQATFQDNTEVGPETQSAATGKFGKDEEPIAVLNRLWQKFPTVIENDKVFGKYVDKKDGKLVWKEGANLSLNKENDLVLAFQQEADKQMESSANYIISNKGKFDETVVDRANKYLKNETFTTNLKDAKTQQEKIQAYDAKLGDFTSSRSNPNLNLVTPKEKELLASKGIFTLKQLQAAGDVEGISDMTKERIKGLGDIGPDADFGLTTYEAPDEPVVEEAPKVNKVEDKTLALPKKKYPTLFYQPDQSVLPPSAQTPETLIQNRFQRIDPIRIGKEDMLQSTADSFKEAAGELETLPPSMRAKMLSGLLGQTQASQNKAGLEINRVNAQNQAAAEQFNIGQSDRENIAQGQNLLNFEGRTLLAKDKTEQDLRGYLDYNHRVSINNFQNQQRLNLINSMFPDYNLDQYGMATNYDPSMEFSIQDRDVINRYLASTQAPVTTTDPNAISQ